MPNQLMGILPGYPPPNPEGPSIVPGYENEFGEPYIIWPDGEYWVADPGGNYAWVTAVTTVQLVDYTDPDGNVTPNTPTVHIGVTDGAGNEDGTRTVPVKIVIPNNPDPNLYKVIFWQMTSDKSATPQGNSPTTNPPGTPSAADPPQSAHGDGTSNWYTYAGINTISPNPPSETLTFGLANSTNIEEIVIKTICMPEPATLGLLGAGGLIALIRRRRR